MTALFRDAPIGQILRLASGGRALRYPEEKPDFEYPASYTRSKSIASSSDDEAFEKRRHDSQPAPNLVETRVRIGENPTEEVEDPARARYGTYQGTDTAVDLRKIETTKEGQGHLETVHSTRTARTTSGVERIGTRQTLATSRSQGDLEAAFSRATQPAGPPEPITPEVLDDGTILVDWYTTDDAENPQNWSMGKKLFVTFQICIYTLAVYIGSSIYSSSIGGVIEEFGVDTQAASLGLSMYVLAYGIGPMLWSPLSEIPAVGRSPPYMITFAIFVILVIPTALATNFDSLIALRFLLGFFGSPCLATGGASLQDMFNVFQMPYMMCLWAVGATLGPALAPTIAGFSVAAENWRWSQWEILWLAGPVWLLMFFCLPETSPENILLRRAKRLRKLTGDSRLKSQSEINQANLTVSQLVIESLWRPIEVMVLDPSVGFSAIYTALIYGIYYSFFEVFPIVYIEGYGFNLGEMGLTFLTIPVGVTISVVFLYWYNYEISNPWMMKNGFGAPERRLVPALVASFFCPIGIFIFAWTSGPDIHWIVSCIGIVIFTIGIFIIIQCIFLYLPFSYPRYAASIFAGNDFARSSLAAGAIHFSGPLFNNLGVGRGNSLLGGLLAGCIFGIFALYFYGPKLRARSRFAAN